MLKVVIVDEVLDPEEVEAAYGSFAGYMQAKLKEFVDNPESPKLIGNVTATVSSEGPFSGPDQIRFTLRGFAEDQSA